MCALAHGDKLGLSIVAHGDIAQEDIMIIKIYNIIINRTRRVVAHGDVKIIKRYNMITNRTRRGTLNKCLYSWN
jgi:hypothetical protein